MKSTSKTESDIISDAAWDTHTCQFYQTKEDLTDVLVPYFQAGLENNEFCMWITGELLDEREIRKTMAKNLPRFDSYLRKGQMQIIPYTEWYLANGDFDQNRVLNTWMEKVNQALHEGYKGMRVTKDAAPLIERDWAHLIDYEMKVNNSIGKYPVMSVCTYPLEKCGSFEVVEVIRAHQCMLTKRMGRWERLEISINERLKNQIHPRPDTIIVSGYESFTTDTAPQNGLDYFCIDLELDPVDFEIIDFACTEVSKLGKKILSEALLGHKVEEGIKNTIDQVEKRLHLPFKEGIIYALEDANRWYQKMKDDRK